jgi:DNA-directed RNA polymerase subunit omega
LDLWFVYARGFFKVEYVLLWRKLMARVTIEDGVKHIPNRFELTLSAALRAREIYKGHLPRVMCQNKSIVTALREIAQNKTGVEMLKKLKP